MRQSAIKAKELSLNKEVIRIEKLKVLEEIEKAIFEAVATQFAAISTRF